MSHIVKPQHVAWDFQMADDGRIEDILAPNGTRTYMARHTRDASGNITGLTGLTVPAILYQSGVNASVGTALAKTTIATYTLKGGSMGVNSRLRVHTFWDTDSSTVSRAAYIDFGGTNIKQWTFNSTSHKLGYLVGSLANQGSLSSQFTLSQYDSTSEGAFNNFGQALSINTASDVVINVAASTNKATPVAIASLTKFSTFVAQAVSAAHGLTTGDYVDMAGATQTEYNVNAVAVTVIDANTFQYAFGGSGTGTATGSPTFARYQKLVLKHWAVELC